MIESEINLIWSKLVHKISSIGLKIKIQFYESHNFRDPA